MAEIVLPVGTEHVTVEEVSGLLALAIHPVPPSGRVVSYLTKQVLSENGQELGVPINGDDMAALAVIWEGLPSMQQGIPEALWPRYAEAFDNAPQKPEWLPVPVWRNDALNAGILRVDAEKEHRRALSTAIARGELAALNHVRLPVTLAYPGALVTIDALREYAAKFGVRLRVAEPARHADASEEDSSTRPRFTIPARPLRVDAAILRLEPDTAIEVCTSLAGTHGVAVGSAKDAIEFIQGTIKRQAEGHYTMQEAAEIIPAARGFDAQDFLDTRMHPAFASGALVLVDPKDGGRVKRRPCRDFHDWVTPANMDKWLASDGFAYRWPVEKQPDEKRAFGTQTGANTVHKLGTRRDVLDPVIDLAVRNSTNPADHAAVWNAFTGLADSKEPPDPLISYREGEVLYRGGDGPTGINRAAFLKRMKRRAEKRR